MQAIQCSKGHYYDQALGQCPQCAAEALGVGGRTLPIETSFSRVEEISETMPYDQSATNSIDDYPTGATASSYVDGNNMSATWVVDETGPTQPTPLNNVSGFDPIVGWLVCVSGPNRGEDYRLHSGKNFIGSSKENDVHIENDRTISHLKAASVSYDEKNKVFYIQSGEGRNLTYLNNEPVLSYAKLAIYDRITIGTTDLLFVPLCCDKFTWQDT